MTNPMNTTRFSEKQVKAFVVAVRKEFGGGWQLLVPRVQEALIAERVLFVLGGQHAEKIATDEIHALLGAMLSVAGLR